MYKNLRINRWVGSDYWTFKLFLINLAMPVNFLPNYNSLYCLAIIIK